MITRCESVPGPCSRCGAITTAGRLVCIECAFPQPQREHPKKCEACNAWNCGTYWICNASAVLTRVAVAA